MADASPRRPLRIGVLTRAVFPYHGYGGLERHVHDLVTHLAARGACITLITRPPLPAASNAQTLAQAGAEGPGTVICTWIPYRTFPFAGRRGTTVLDRSTAYPLFGYRAGLAAARLAAAGRLDVVYGLGAASLGYAVSRRRSASAAPAPFVFNPQGLEEFGATDDTYGGSRFKRWAYLPLQRAVRACANAADRVIATDRSLVRVVQHHLRVPDSRLRVVPNGIDLAGCRALAGPEDGARMRARAGLAGAEPLLLSVGRIEENKGFHVLLQALGRLRDVAWRLVLVGDGPFRPRLEGQLDRLGLRDRAVLAGRVSDRDLHGYYEAADLFVHPTLYEGSSLVTLEAMAHGRAVVATRAGGLPDKVIHGTTGWLVPPGSADALEAALRDALGGPRHRLAVLGGAGRGLAEREFAWPAIAARLLVVCEEVLSESTTA